MTRLEAIGARLRAVRLERGEDQATFAALGGVSRNSQVAYEKGRTPFTIEYLSALSEHGVDVSLVVTGRKDATTIGAEERHVLYMLNHLSRRERQGVFAMLAVLADDGKSAIDLTPNR